VNALKTAPLTLIFVGNDPTLKNTVGPASELCKQLRLKV